jgi:hypothetical protein
MRYPPIQPLTIMPIATPTRAEPKTFPTTVGIVEKKPPFAMPLMITKAISGPRELERGHITIKLTALRRRVMKSVVNEPNLSHAKPDPRRPIAEQKLKAASRPAPADEGRPSDLLYSGRKKGGTKSGNVPMTPTANTSENWTSLKSFHSTNWVFRIGTRSFISHAAGSPVARIMNPKIRNAHGMPRLLIRASSMKLMAVPPRPPPAYTMPLATPRLVLKYCAGVIEAVCRYVSSRGV